MEGLDGEMETVPVPESFVRANPRIRFPAVRWMVRESGFPARVGAGLG